MQCSVLKVDAPAEGPLRLLDHNWFKCRLRLPQVAQVPPVVCEARELSRLVLEGATQHDRKESWRRFGAPSYNHAGFHCILLCQCRG